MSFLKIGALLVFVTLFCTSCYVGVPTDYPAPAAHGYYPGPYYASPGPYAYYPGPYYSGPALGLYFDIPLGGYGGRGGHRGWHGRR